MDGKRFYEVRARLGTLDEAVRVARTLDASGVAYVAVDSGEGYGLRECTAEGCAAILAYPDEGAACVDHTCAACGGVVDTLEAFPYPYRDTHTQELELDDTATACKRCYHLVMVALSPDYYARVARLESKRRVAAKGGR